MNEVQHLNSSEYETLRALLPAYGLGMTDTEETALVEKLLEKYPEAAAELDNYKSLGEAMLYSPPQITPPPHLRDNLMQAAETTTQSTPGGSTLSFPGGRWLLPALAAAVIVVLLALNAYSVIRVSDIQVEHRHLTGQMEAQSELLALFAASEIASFELPDVREAGGEARAVLLCNPGETVAMLRVENFPELSSDQAYQLWLLRDGERDSGGLFRVDADGQGMLVFYAPEVMGRYQLAGITAEPASGSDGPTSPPVVRGTLYTDGAEW